MAHPTVRADDVVLEMVRVLVAEVLGSERAALADEPDGVHTHRTRVRRLRGVLSAGRGALDPAQIEPLRVGLRRWGRQLGVVRDAEVSAQVLASALSRAGTDAASAARSGADHVDDAEYRRLHRRLLALAELPVHAQLKTELRELAEDPRLTASGTQARELLGAMLRNEWRRVRRAARAVDGSLSSHHALRKAARRLRYAAEAVDAAAPELFGDELRDVAHRAKKLQGLLGDHRDALLVAQRLRSIRAHALRSGESAEPYSAAIEAMKGRAAGRLDRVPKALRRLKRATAKLETER
jgi:CHAD domain-containing protein